MKEECSIKKSAKKCACLDPRRASIRGIKGWCEHLLSFSNSLTNGVPYVSNSVYVLTRLWIHENIWLLTGGTVTKGKYEILWCSQLPSILRHACIFRIIESNVQESYDYVKLRCIDMSLLICQFVWSDFNHLYWSYKCITDVHSFRCMTMITIFPSFCSKKNYS